MNECSKIQPLLALSAGGEFDPKGAVQVKRHLSICRECREAESVYSRLMGAARIVARDEHQLHPGIRARIVREASARAARRPRFWGVPLPLLLSPHRSGMLAAAGVLVALAALPALLHDRPATAYRTAGEVTKIRVVSENGLVRVAWSNGHKASYTVYKSTDPRDVSRAEAHVVKGNIWTDTEPGRSPVVFYRVE